MPLTLTPLSSPTFLLLNAADAYFDAREMNANPQCHVGLRMYQWMLEKDRRARLANQAALRALAQRRNGVLVFSSHDPSEFERLADRAADVPAGAPASRHDV